MARCLDVCLHEKYFLSSVSFTVFIHFIQLGKNSSEIKTEKIKNGDYAPKRIIIQKFYKQFYIYF